jgi:hypothetical protein
MRVEDQYYTKMRTFWKILYASLFVVFGVTFAVNVSMYFWPSIPSSPRPAEGRIYPLNNHGKHTYMNRQEYLLDEDSRLVLPIILVAIGAIYYFVDPFEQKKRQRSLRPPRP